ncbi:amidohydrolase [Herbiconiux sp. YIM B11900]|uniref:amidohydrolase n=1 Tax=Herbiconiux sp. YIM B11900 TaxID=3404131 RepID=UPI003F878AEE
MSLVLTNAIVHTSDPAHPRASTVVIEDSTIAYVGDGDDWQNTAGLPVVDLGGRTLTAGFVDSHTHPSMVTQSLWHVRLPWTSDVDDLLAFIRDYAETHPPEEVPFLYFEYYPSETFRDREATKELLDSAVSDRPCLCQDFSEHEHWVNSRMIELMGITASTPDPIPGLEMFVRDEAGEPTGLLREMVHLHYMDRVYAAIGWTPPHELTPERIAPFFEFMTRHGVTAVFEALVEDEAMVESVAELDRRGELTLHYSGALRFRGRDDLPGVIERLARLQAHHGGRHVRMNTLKLFLDGTNESGNSAVLAPMCVHGDDGDDGDGGGRGLGLGLGEMSLECDELVDCLLLAESHGVDVHIHLVGDRAFRIACDAVEIARRMRRAAAGGGAGAGDFRSLVTLAHCELIDPADLRRPAELGIIVNWTCHWSGGYFGEGARRHLGDERWNRMYRFTEIADSGAVLAFSSDVVTGYELHRADPLFGMQVARSRIDPEYPLDPERFAGSVRPGAGDQLRRETLLEGYTIGGARQLGIAATAGSIEVGKCANLVVLSDDPLAEGRDDLSTIAVDAVLFEGRVVSGSL